MIRKTAIIIGGSGGIGGEIAREFARSGYNVAFTYNAHPSKSLEKELAGLGVDAKSYKLDVCDEKATNKIISKIFKDFDYVDTLIYASGIAQKINLLSDMETDEIDNLLSVNLRGYILCCREVSKFFIKQKHGSIVGISSVQGVNGSSCESVYSASKAGMLGLTQALASELGQYNIRVNAIAPGFIETEMTSHFTKEEKEKMAQLSPLNRLGNPSDIAPLALFLASDKASFITGECITVSGGVTKF